MPRRESVVQAALDDGCRAFDTAPHYGNGLSEHRVGAALRATPPDQRFLSTKVGRILVPDSNAPREQNGYVDVLPFVQRWDYSRDGIRRSVEDSMQRLGVARIDVAFIHDCDEVTHGTAYATVRKQVVSEAIPELQRLQREGIIGYYGLGVNDVQVCLDVLGAADVDCLLLAGRYSLLDQSALGELLPLCVQRGVRIALGGVFNSGILATGVTNRREPIRFNYGPASQDWITKAAAIEEACGALRRAAARGGAAVSARAPRHRRGDRGGAASSPLEGCGRHARGRDSRRVLARAQDARPGTQRCADACGLPSAGAGGLNYGCGARPSMARRPARSATFTSQNDTENDPTM